MTLDRTWSQARTQLMCPWKKATLKINRPDTITAEKHGGC